MKYSSLWNKTINLWKTSTSWDKIFYASLFLIILSLASNSTNNIEGMTNSKKKKSFIVKRGNDIYDDFYVSVYDELVFCKDKNDFEVMTIKDKTKITQHSKVLDIGSGTGHHVASFNDNGVFAEGIDKSISMIKHASKLYPKYKYTHGDVTKSMLYQHGIFSHITCFYFTIYYIEDKKSFIQNCYEWLDPNGYFLLHLVDRNKFDPIIPAGDPLELISAQKYANERITTTKVKFDGYDYSSKFVLDGDEAIMHEEFKNTKDGSVRKNEHKLYMPSQKHILNIALEVGFKVIGNIDMKTCQYETQYLYILRKI